MKNLVTVILPIYNVEAYLVKSVNSIINQTYSNLEIILVNDGSLDNCPKICDDFAKKDPRIKVIHKKNGGLSDARNVGIESAKGKYITFLDSDDYVELNLIEIAITSAELTKSDIITWGYYVDFMSQDENLNNTIIHKYAPGIYTKKEFKKIPIDTSFIANIGYAWNKMYRQEFIMENNLRFEKGLSLVEDIVFNSTAFSLSEKIVCLEDILTHYMKRPHETLGSKFHDNYFQLKLKGRTAVRELLEAWHFDKKEISRIISLLEFSILKNILGLLTKSNTMSYTQKKAYLNNVFQSLDIVLAHGVKVSSLKDKIILSLIKKRKTRTLLSLYEKIQKN